MSRIPTVLSAFFLMVAVVACEPTPTDTQAGVPPETTISAQQGPPPGVGPPEGTGPPEGRGPPPGRGPAFLSRIAFSAGEIRRHGSEIWVMGANGSDRVQLTDQAAARDPAWSPDGTRIAFASTATKLRAIGLVNPDGSGLSALAPAAPAACEEFWGGLGKPTWSPDGMMAFAAVCDGQTDIFVMNSDDGTNVSRLTENSGLDTDPAWSPDGSQIAFMSDRSGKEEIWVMDADGSNQEPLGPNIICILHAPRTREPAWSPDGARIAFSSDCLAGNRDVYLMNRDGSNVLQVTDHSDDDVDPAWSPDGAAIAFARLGGSDSDDIWVMSPDGSFQTNLSEGSALSETSPSWEP